jgi:hypothetical protein
MAITDFSLFGRSKQQLSGRTLDSEENVLETTAESLRKPLKDDVKTAFVD